MKISAGTLLLINLWLYPLAGPAQVVQVLNPSFEQASNQKPDNWTLTNAHGGTTERLPFDGDKSLWIQGDSTKSGSGWWQSAPLALASGRVYLLYFSGRRSNLSPAGCAIAGTDKFSVDIKQLSEKWQSFRQVLVTPYNSGTLQLRLGQKGSADRFEFDGVRLVPGLVVHRRIGNVELGFGERIVGDRFNFAPPMAELHSNYFRPLRYLDGRFDTDRCIFDPGTHIEFEHEINDHPLKAAKLYLWTKHEGSAVFSVQVNKNSGKWISLADAKEGQKQPVVLPDSLFPLQSLRVRLSADAANTGRVLLSGYRLEGTLAGVPLNAAGETYYFDIEQLDPGVGRT